ncbi:MAG: transporter permease [Herbinix sp.]|jgi:putative ABC transport system permease protein|nr:transporter permease [Herbinix sp.]
MKQIVILSLANLRKGKGQTASFMVMMLISSILFNLGIITWLNFNDNFDRKSAELNAEHSLMIIQKKDYSDALLQYIQQDNRVSKTQKRDVLFVNLTVPYSNGDLSMATVIMNNSVQTELSKISFVEKSEQYHKDAIYIPYLFKSGGKYQIGDTITLTIGLKKFSYTVAGFFESMLLGSINVNTVAFLLDEANYLSLSEQLGAEAKGVILQTQLKNQEDSELFTADLQSYFHDTTNNETVFTRSVSYSMAKSARTLTAGIGSMIIVAFSIIIVLVSLIVIRFRIRNSIDEDIQNIGTLKAIGFTSKQIILSILLQFIGISMLSVFAGIALSYGLLPLLSAAYAAQSGILWKQGFDISSAFITILVIIGTVAITSFLSAVKIRNLHPIMALRNSITTHNFRRNHIPLHRFKGNLNLSLAFKSILQNKKQNLMITLIIAAISFASVFALVLYYNIAIDTKAFLTIVGEMSDVSIALDPEQYDEKFIDTLRSMDEVEKALYYDQRTLLYQGSTLYAYITPDYSKTENTMCYKGRQPKHDNEVAIGGGMADDYGIQVGDSIEIINGVTTKEYLVSGFIQSGNGMGYDMEITSDGYLRLQENYKPSNIYVYLSDNVNADSFIEKIGSAYGDRFASSIDVMKMINSQLGIYTQIVSILVMIIVLVTIAIVTLILHLVIKTIIIRKKRELGIQKALGFTTGQLMLQLSFSLFPVVMFGTILGSIAGFFLTNPLLAVLFRGIGMMKLEFTIQPVLILGLCIGISLFAFLISILVSIRIRKISAYTLITE